LNVLKCYGIDGPTLKWITDFLTNRKQRVCVNGNKSNLFEVLSGVPQGSVLGPLLFVIYINTMIGETSDNNVYLYADDLKLFREIKSPADQVTLQRELNQLENWTKDSLLQFHPDKCKNLRFKPKSKTTDATNKYTVGDTMMEVVSEFNDLGITFTQDLSFHEHINKKVKKANSLAGMLRRTFTHLDKDNFKQLFTSIVRPHLEYGAPIWNPHHRKLIDTIEKVQRRATKQLPPMSELSYKERLKLLQLPTLEYRRYRGDMIEAYKLSHKLYDEKAAEGLLNYCNKEDTQYRIRKHRYTLCKEKWSKDVKRFSFKNRISNQWNNLPEAVVNSPTLNTFKNRLDKLWEQNDVMYDAEIDLNETISSRKVRYYRVKEE